MAEKTVKVNFHEDGEHLWIDGNQFVSLERFLQVQKDIRKEAHILNKRVEELTRENEAFRQTIKALSHD